MNQRGPFSVIVLVVIEMKRLGKFASIPLAKHAEILGLLNETIGEAAGSSEKGGICCRGFTGNGRMRFRPPS